VSSDFLCGYNIKGFDIPFIVKRAVILGIKIPNTLKPYGKKPWEMTGIDDLYEVWKHMSGKACSLDTLCGALNIPTPKDKMNGAQVDDYFRDGRLDEIVEYCVKDVQACVKVRNHFVIHNLI
jgi:predicted PolB exonuclease-like 3'-5' exonuclease